MKGIPILGVKEFFSAEIQLSCGNGASNVAESQAVSVRGSQSRCLSAEQIAGRGLMGLTTPNSLCRDDRKACEACQSKGFCKGWLGEPSSFDALTDPLEGLGALIAGASKSRSRSSSRSRAASLCCWGHARWHPGIPKLDSPEWNFLFKWRFLGSMLIFQGFQWTTEVGL